MILFNMVLKIKYWYHGIYQYYIVMINLVYYKSIRHISVDNELQVAIRESSAVL